MAVSEVFALLSCGWTEIIVNPRSSAFIRGSSEMQTADGAALTTGKTTGW